MSDAWVTYNEATLELVGVAWNEPLVPSIKISRALAEDFMHGKETLIKWSAKNTNGEMTIEKGIDDQMILPSFWSLIVGDDNGMEIPLRIEEDMIIVISKDKQPIPAMLYATIKNDPTWLVESWNLYDRNIHKGIVTIHCENAKDYSYYMDRIK